MNILSVIRLNPNSKVKNVHNFRGEYRDMVKWRISRRGQRRRKLLKHNEFLTKFKNRPCADCQGWFNPWQMDLDHIDRTTKTATVTSLKSFSTKRLLAEVRKCEVVCANCHRERTQMRKDWVPVVKKGPCSPNFYCEIRLRSGLPQPPQ